MIPMINIKSVFKRNKKPEDILKKDSKNMDKKKQQLLSLQEQSKELEEKKLEIVALQNELKEFALVQVQLPNFDVMSKLMNFNLDLQKASGRTPEIVPVFAFISTRGYSVLRRAVEIDDEHILVEVEENETVKYFTHVKPSFLAIEASFFGKINAKGWKYAKIHWIRGHEPVSRDLFTGAIADHNKKINKLVELGILLPQDHKTVIETWGTQDNNGNVIKPKSPTGYFISPIFADVDDYGQPLEEYDVSDIDAITSEVLRAEEDQLVKLAIRAAYEEYEEPDTKSLLWVMLGAAIFGIIIVMGSLWTIQEMAKTYWIPMPLMNILRLITMLGII
jgi:hypothetical protein